jgi:hypothetical protein
MRSSTRDRSLTGLFLRPGRRKDGGEQQEGCGEDRRRHGEVTHVVLCCARRVSAADKIDAPDLGRGVPARWGCIYTVAGKSLATARSERFKPATHADAE